MFVHRMCANICEYIKLHAHPLHFTVVQGTLIFYLIASFHPLYQSSSLSHQLISTNLLTSFHAHSDFLTTSPPPCAGSNCGKAPPFRRKIVYIHSRGLNETFIKWKYLHFPTPTTLGLASHDERMFSCRCGGGTRFLLHISIGATYFTFRAASVEFLVKWCYWCVMLRFLRLFDDQLLINSKANVGCSTTV